MIPLYLSLLVVVFLVVIPTRHLITSASAIKVSYTTVRCFTNSTNYTLGSQFQDNLNVLLIRSFYEAGRLSLFSNLTQGEEPDKVYGLFLCRGDFQPEVCQECLEQARQMIVKQCPQRKQAIIWYDECLIRYSDTLFFTILQTDPMFGLSNGGNASDPDRFSQLVDSTLINLRKKAVESPSDGMFERSEIEEPLVKLYSMVQCTSDLSPMNCYSCLSDAFSFVRSFAIGKAGARVLSPSCNIRYELYSFLLDPPPAAQPPSAANETKGSASNGGRKVEIIAISTSVSMFLVVALLGSYIYYQRRRIQTGKVKDNSSEIDLLEWGGGRFDIDYSSENLQGDQQVKPQDFPSIPLDVILAATEHFSEQNKLGEGGFGPVYKGTLVDGKEIAVKRLSKTSGQGLQEFKTEVTLIARLQHRNLVRLLGCCLEGKELLLVYEYMPNKSLDVILYDSTRGAQLDWSKRHLIINGIARGILYLHEDSRLRIIHRDLKTSNVLLDHEMNPKISDFGMARIFGGNQSEANTIKVVGTYGYMAPEYAMEGLFSIKSDVFSFGVVLLEIVSGRRNNGFHLTQHGQSLLTFAWKLWSEGQGLELVDPLVIESCVPIEVLKCIHIGLLCVQEDPADRPTMSFVVVMLGSDTVTLPQPTQPAFSVGRHVLQSQPNINLPSVNEITISDVSPR